MINLLNKLWTFHGGLKLNGHKNLSNSAAIVKAQLPARLILPLLQHIGSPAEPIVKVGDRVLKGQIVAHCGGQHHDGEEGQCLKSRSAPIHAPTSGTVIALENHAVPHRSGLTAPCIILQPDGLEEWTARTPLLDYTSVEPELLHQHIARAGIVGLGGAGYPAHLKIKPAEIETLILNGAECEPYITCDDRLMRERALDIVGGVDILRYILGGIKRCVIAVEDNKPEAYYALIEAVKVHNELLKRAQQTPIEIVQVPTLYPMGSSQHLTKVLTGKEVPADGRSSDIGVLVHNVGTVYAIYRAVRYGEPLLSRIVTVSGTGVEKPQNLEVLIGTPIRDIINQCGRKDTVKRIVVGGSMMGFPLQDDDLPVIKTTNCVIVSQPEEITINQPQMPCIRCGACADACPESLLPQQLYWHAKAKDMKRIENFHLFDCIECGCCAYVCPSQIPLVDYFHYAKTEIRSAARDKQKAEAARQRHEFRQMRIEREKLEKAEKHKQKREVLTPTAAPAVASASVEVAAAAPVVSSTAEAIDPKKAAIEAAIARAKAKKAAQQAEQPTPPTGDVSL